MRRTVTLLAVIFIAAFSRAITAAPAAEAAAAQALFQEGRQLMEQGVYDRSCAKFAESHRIDPAVGTLLNLALCYEKAGKTASAWATYLEAAAASRSRSQKEREDVARERAASIEPRLTKLTVTVAKAGQVPALEVKRDGQVVGQGTWGTAIPIDPGQHVIEACAPNYHCWRRELVAAEAQPNLALEVPPLEPIRDAPAAPPTTASTKASTPAEAPPLPSRTAVTSTSGSQPPPRQIESARGGRPYRTAGLVVLGAGGLGIVSGSILGILAYSKNQDSKAQCQSETICTQAGYDLRKQALSAANFSTIAFAVGATSAIVGSVLLLFEPRGRSYPRATRQNDWTAKVGFAPGMASLSLQGSF